jgi:hypothetical protein
MLEEVSLRQINASTRSVGLKISGRWAVFGELHYDMELQAA